MNKVPEGIVPRNPESAEFVAAGVDYWWREVLTPEQRVGLWARYSDGKGIGRG